MKWPVHNSVFHSPEVNNKIKLIGLMAVCMEHTICDTLIALLIFWLSQRNKKAKAYILLWYSCFIMTCTLAHEA
jgi:hypothetical protein